MRKRGLLLLVAGALALVGCGGGKSSSTTPTEASGPVTIAVEIKGGKPVGGIQRASAKKGDTVALVVHSDVADEVHVHGYDLHRDVKAGGLCRSSSRRASRASSRRSSRAASSRSSS